MSIEALQKEIAKLDEHGLWQIINYAVEQRQKRNPSLAQKLSEALDDPDPARWVSLEEAERRWDAKPGRVKE